MAKRKNATALFEVMTRSQMSSAPSRLLSAPPAAHAPSPAPRPEPKVDPEPDFDTPRAARMEIKPVIAPVAMAVDRQNRQVWLRMSYRSAIFGAMGILTIVFGALVVGRLMKANGTRLNSARPEPLPVVTGVLDPHTSANLPRNDAHEPAAINRSSGSSSSSDRSIPPSTIDDTQRVLELNYVVVQSYPDEATAESARKFLTDNGVPCTVERDLHGCPKNTFIVVGIRGFAHVSTNEYKDYIARIKHLSDQFAPPIRGQRNYKAFEPWGYKWNKVN